MLPRTLEPEVMDSAEEARDYDAMDHAQVNRVFVADLLAQWDGRGIALDVGAGTALILLELCRQAPSARVLGIDLAQQMLLVARANVLRARLDDRLWLTRTDAKCLPFAAGTFGAVISNTILHHIPQPRAALAEMVRVTRPGGRLFVRDLLRPASEDAVQELVAAYAGDANAHQQRMFADSLRAALTLDEIRALATDLGISPTAVRATSDRHWTLCTPGV